MALLAFFAVSPLFADGGRSIPPVKDGKNPDDLIRELRRMSENVIPSAGGDRLFYRDIKNERIGIGTPTPQCTLDVNGPICGIGSLYVMADAHGATGRDTTDDTDAIQSALDTGKVVWLTQGATYYISSKLTVSSRSGIVSDGSATIYMSSSGFNNSDGSAGTRYGTNAVGIDASGELSGSYAPNTNIVFYGFTLRSQVADSRILRGILARNVRNLRIENVEFTGFPVGSAICLASIGGGSYVVNNYIHDMTSNVNWWPTSPQITAIDVDNDQVNSMATRNLIISGNTIKDITVGSVLLSTHGYQADAINILSQNAQYIVVSNNSISTTGEGIDFYGSYSTISGNTINDTYIFGIKLVHGANNNAISGNTITNSGNAGIIFAGSGTASEEVEHNVVSGNRIVGIDHNNVWASSTTSACIKTETYGGPSYTSNNLFTGNSLEPGTYGEYGIANNSGSTNNDFIYNHIESSGTLGYVTGTAGQVYSAVPTHVRAYNNSGQSISTTTANKIQYDTENYDNRGEYDPSTNYRWTALEPGFYRVEAQVRFGTISSGIEWTMEIRKNGSADKIVGGVTSGASNQFPRISGAVSVVPGDYIEVWISIGDTASRSITAGSVYSTLSIDPAS